MRTTTLMLLAVVSAGCVKRYESAPPLEFRDYPYVGEAGNAWPLKSVELKGAQQRYGLGHAPKLSYVELNEGGAQTVVFLHGLGSYLKFWRSQLDATAAKGYRVIAIDQLGFGKSEKPATFPYTTESFAENVVELLELLGVQKAILVGHSMGGQTSLATAIRFPERVAGLVLVSPAGFETFSGREQKWFKNVYARVLIKDADEESIWGSVRNYNFMHWRPELEWLIEERVRVAKTNEFDAYAYAQVRVVEGLAKNNFVRESLAKVKAPTVIVYGTADKLIPNAFLHGGFTRDVMKAGHEQIAGSELVELAGCGHTLQLDCPAQFNEALFAFLAKQPKPEAPPAAPVEAKPSE
ncbi:MAG: alpha/beta fold hydrolase [Myxococcota bacterium]